MRPAARLGEGIVVASADQLETVKEQQRASDK
jgi:hypothetical protein